MQSLQMQHGSRNVTVYYEVQRGRAVSWSASVTLSTGGDQLMSGALAGKHITAETVLDRLRASVRSGIDWLESQTAIAPAH